MWRIVFDAALVASVILGWWYAAAAVGIVGAIVFPYYAEFVVAGLAYDSIYGMGKGLGIYGYLSIVFSVGILGIISLLKRVMKW